jgi:hypothetical protein
MFSASKGTNGILKGLREGHVEAHSATSRLMGRKSALSRPMNQFYSVEFSIRGLDVLYQFRIWDIFSSCMCILVKEYSDILPRLKVGDTWNMKYYSTGSVYRPECLKTVIRHITKNDQGRFKGHYLVGLEILEKQDRNRIH